MHNLFYNDIAINYPFLNKWEDEFISEEITNYLVLYNSDSQERESYVVLLRDDNFENNLD